MIHFSILVTTYNRHELLNRTLQSLYDQTYNHFTIYLFDNGSEPPVDPSTLDVNFDIKYYRNKSNLRDARTPHRIVNEMEGTHVLTIADDDVLLPSTLEIVSEYFRNTPEMESLGVGFSKFDHDTCQPLISQKYMDSFSGKLHRYEGYKTGLQYCSVWGIGKNNDYPLAKMAHPSASFVSFDLIRRTIARQKELFVKPFGDVGYVGCNFNCEYVHYLDLPLAVLGDSSRKEMDGSKINSRHHWRDFLRYLDLSPLKSCSWTNMALESHLKVLYQNGIDKHEDLSIRPCFFLSHISSVLSDDPWTDETDRDLKEAMPFAIESLVKHKGLPRTTALVLFEDWLAQELRKIKEIKMSANSDSCCTSTTENRSRDSSFGNINEFARWQEKEFVMPNLEILEFKSEQKISKNTDDNFRVVQSESRDEIPISLSITVYNEEARIRYVLESSIEWADRIVVLNKSSTDRTKEICLQYGEKVKVFDIPFSPSGHDDTISNLKRHTTDWVYVGTASEVPTKGLIRKIKQVLRKTGGNLDLIYVPRKYYSFGIHDKRSPWSISYFPFVVNRKKAIISNTIHRNFRPKNPKNTAKIEFSDDCCVYHLTHPTAKQYLLSMTDYFQYEAEKCENPDMKIKECMANIARFEKQLRSGGNDLLGHYFAWQIYWLGTALFVWEKWRGIDVKRYYKELRENVFKEEWLQENNEDPAFRPDETPLGGKPQKEPLVSAIVSTFNSERFIRGCLEDLESQTIRNELEIIVIDSASEQNEEAIVKEFQAKYSNIKYIKTEQRETVYAAWNRGINAASGKYITNANTDDRHLPYAFERMVHVLENTSDISLVYADVWITQNENETHRNFTAIGTYCWKDFDPTTLVDGCYIGPQPMWRKDIHEEYGYFDETFHSAGDWEFWLRISQTRRFLHLNEFLGLYLKSPTSVEHRNRELSREEEKRIRRRYASGKVDAAKSVQNIYQNALSFLSNGKREEAKAALLKLVESFPDFATAYNDLGVLCINENDTNNALKYYRKAFDLEPRNPTFAKNLADLYYVKLGLAEKALEIYVKLLADDPEDIEILTTLGHVCISLDRYDSAKTFFCRVLEKDPQNQDARRIVEELQNSKRLEGIEHWNTVTTRKAVDLTGDNGDDFGDNPSQKESCLHPCDSWRVNPAAS